MKVLLICRSPWNNLFAWASFFPHQLLSANGLRVLAFLSLTLFFSSLLFWILQLAEAECVGVPRRLVLPTRGGAVEMRTIAWHQAREDPRSSLLWVPISCVFWILRNKITSSKIKILILKSLGQVTMRTFKTRRIISNVLILSDELFLNFLLTIFAFENFPSLFLVFFFIYIFFLSFCSFALCIIIVRTRVGASPSAVVPVYGHSWKIMVARFGLS